METNRPYKHWVWTRVVVGFALPFFAGCGIIGVEPQPMGNIVFTSSRDSELGEIYIMNVDGSEIVQVTNNEFPDFDPALSPDGTQIVFSSERNSKNEVYIINVDGGGETQLTFDNGALAPAWSPSGQWITFSEDDGIYIMRPDGSELRLLIDTQGLEGGTVWSPDSSQIAFFSTQDDEAGGINNFEIYTTDIDGNQLERLTFNPAREGPYDWSPDGKYLLFGSDRGIGRYESRVYVLDIESGEVRLLIKDDSIFSGKQEGTATWSPDGNWIALTIGGRLCIVNADGEVWKCLSDGYKDGQPDWGS